MPRTPREAAPAVPQGEAAGVVLGSVDATPLEFWVGVRDDQEIQLDDLIQVDTPSSTGTPVRFYGVVDQVRKRYEGAQFDTDVRRSLN